MHVEFVPNRGSHPTVLLRQSYREDGKVKKRTLANLTDWAPEKIEALRRALRGDGVAAAAGGGEILRSLPHGHVAAVLGTMRALGFPAILASKPSRQRSLCMAMIAARLLRPDSKLATAAGYAPETATDTLSSVLDVEDAGVDELYAALDWLRDMQPHIEKKLARRHLTERCLVLYDLTSTWMEGSACPAEPALHGTASAGGPRSKRSTKRTRTMVDPMRRESDKAPRRASARPFGRGRIRAPAA